MATQLDHLVILVPKLEAAVIDATAAGFTVVPGGQPAWGISHNALIAFSDGSYLEFFAFLDPTRPSTSPWWPRLATGGGFVDYALLSTDLEAETADIRANGVAFPEPWGLGRLRSDGQRIEWTLATPESNGWPILIEDMTLRSLRVPCEQEERTHPNGATGVSGVTILVPDLDAAKASFGAIAGTSARDLEPPIAGIARAAQITIGSERGQWLCLAEPASINDAVDDDASVPARYLDKYGPGPFSFTVTTSVGAEPAPPGAGTLIEPARLGNARCLLS